MTINEEFRSRLTAIFRPLDRTAGGSFPPAATLSHSLKDFTPRRGATSRGIAPALAGRFGTAAVDIWLRSVHSFLVSASLTEVSPIWASVSGYYSSHYAVRGFAHLLGYFYFFNGQKIVRLEPGSRGYTCSFAPKPTGTSSGGEHQLYWALVKQDSTFTDDPLFTYNKQGKDESDSGHRNYANYIDHLSKYPTFRPLDKDVIKDRIDRISKMVPEDTPIPRLGKFPDVEYVQIVAYRRIVAFRQVLDEVLGQGNRLWTVNRNPPFAMEFMNFQLAETEGLLQPNRP